jgi:hypothetical protein
MQSGNPIRTVFVGGLIVAALLTLALSATACSTVASSAPATTPQAATPAATDLTSARVARSTGPTAAQGQTVVQRNCIGQCHGSSLLQYRTSQASAQRIASAMGRRARISATKQQAVALFLAQ